MADEDKDTEFVRRTASKITDEDLWKWIQAKQVQLSHYRIIREQLNILWEEYYRRRKSKQEFQEENSIEVL